MDGITEQQYVETGLTYAKGVVAGEIVACKWVKAACQRQLDDLERWQSEDSPYWFSPDAASRVCQFIELLPHIKGPKSGQLIELEPWQCFVLTTIFGWMKTDTGKRRYRKVYIEIPRGNAKSTLSSGVGLYMGFADGEGGADVYSAATTKEQALIVFRDAQQMAKNSPDFRKEFGVTVLANNIHQPSTNSKFMAKASEDGTLDGLNIHFAVVDELHAHKTRLVHDVLETGIGKRNQSMLWEITTAGSNRTGICYEVRSYVLKLLNAVLRRHDGFGYKVEGDSADDEQYFGIVYSIDDGEDWTTAEALEKANPNWAISVEVDSILGIQRKALQTASAVNNFLTKHLNCWVSSETAWMDMRAWDACAYPGMKLEDFAGESVGIGIDLASKTDIAAMALIFERDGHYYVFGKYYLPEDTIDESRNSQYAGWVRDGRLTPTPGNIIDFNYIENDLRALKSQFEIRHVAYDPFQATHFATNMLAEGFPMIETSQTVRSLSEPMKQLEALVLSRRIHHDGDPVAGWMMSNVVCHTDVKENIYPRKEAAANKIDFAVATIMDLSWMLPQHSAYTGDTVVI